MVAQIVAEIADGGVICQGEANVLRDVVETGPGVLRNLLGGVGLPGSGSALQTGSGGLASASTALALTPAQSSQGSAIPWRRSHVRHTNNELKVDIVESLSVTLAPSGRPLAAFAHGSIAFTAQVSGVPDLLLSLSPTGGRGNTLDSATRAERLRALMQRVVFHPCVRLNRWRSEGVMSFVPPDGRFALCGYEVDLLGAEKDQDFSPTSKANNAKSLSFLPATVEITTGLGAAGTEFEVRAIPSGGAGRGGASSAAAASLQSHLSSSSTSSARPGAVTSNSGSLGGGLNLSGGLSGLGSSSGDSKSPSLEHLTVSVPLPAAVRNVSDLRPTRGEAQWNPAESAVEWRLPVKDFGIGTSGGGSAAVLRCSVLGPLGGDDGDADIGNGLAPTTYDYDEGGSAAEKSDSSATAAALGNGNGSSEQKAARNRELMPTSATLSFSVKGWLASGLKVESLLVDTKKSRELGAQVKPYKGVKYLTVSRQGVEMRC